MEVILLDRIRNLGNLGDTVSVKPGYGRNYLIPQGKAVAATSQNVKLFESRRAELEKKVAEVLGEAQKRAAQLTNKTLTLIVRASDEGKLYGSVATHDIADEFQKQGIEIHKSEVLMPSGVIREVGEYDIDISLHSDVTVTVKVVVQKEETNH
ncbi:MAG: 50S ribosomal protein L9 [Legionellales bacterium]|nr:50S ribosomal protein L9 [Legionellales bacterium]